MTSKERIDEELDDLRNDVSNHYKRLATAESDEVRENLNHWILVGESRIKGIEWAAGIYEQAIERGSL